jgi:tight adherence protein B
MIVAASLAAVAVWLVLPPKAADPHIELVRLSDFVAHAWAARPGAHRQVVVDRRQWVLRFVTELAAELRGGQAPERAWWHVWGDGPPHSNGPPMPTAHLPVDLFDVMLMSSEVPGCAGLRQVAACWQVSELTGAGLAPALDRVARSIVADQDLTAEIRAQLAGPRASTRMLVVLPLFALLLGSSLGVHPVHVLLHDPVGWGCLAAGSILLALGWWWSQRQVHSVLEWAGQP